MTFPRRNRLDQNTPAELAIRKAVDAVEEVGAHELLTKAVIKLQEARELVADYVDGFARCYPAKGAATQNEPAPATTQDQSADSTKGE